MAARQQTGLEEKQNHGLIELDRSIGRLNVTATKARLVATKPEAFKLFHEGALALSWVESNGIRIDVDRLQKTTDDVDDRIRRISSKLRKDELWGAWRRIYGDRANIDAREQLGRLLFNELGYDAKEKTDKGRNKVDESTLNDIELPFVKRWIKRQKLLKIRNTYLKNIQQELVGEFIHPNYNLHIPVSFRSSSDSPNFQNMPIRDPEMGKIIRQLFIARDDYQLGECDFGGVEVRGAACYTKDRRLIDYINDPSKDMHRDMAAQCYDIDAADVAKAIRHCGKNMFVFPQFYGDYYINCARSMWEAAEKMDLKLNSGESLIQHLRRKFKRGLGACDPSEKPTPGTFEHHIQKIEQDFWKRRFKDYNNWKQKWWTDYNKRGWFPLLTGFTATGVYTRNEATNIPIQGVAFHWLLWTLIQVSKKLRKYRMKTKIVGQIHDSIISDIHQKEIHNFFEIVHEVITIGLRKHWPWIIVPLEAEYELVPPGGTWHDKKEYKL